MLSDCLRRRKNTESKNPKVARIIAVFWNPKKRNRSDDSKTGDYDSKKPQEGGSGSYTNEADMFEEAVESADCRKVLFDCLKNLEEKTNDLYMLADSNKEM